MNRTIGAVVVLSVLAASGASHIAAQDEVEDRPAFRGQPRVEAIMQMRDRLELSEDQVAELDAIRAEIVAERSAASAELAELRSQLAAGQIQRSDVMAYMEDRREATSDVGEELQARIDAVLTDAQRTSLQEMRGQARAFVRGRLSVRGGDRGFQRGGRQFRGGGQRFRRGGERFRRGGNQFRRGRRGIRAQG